jgi:malic enzyme
LVNIVAGLYEAERVLRAAIHPHLVVEVGAGGTAGIAHCTDSLAQGDMLADADRNGREVSVTGLETVTVVDLDGVAITRAYPCEGDDARGSRLDR